jgi:acetyl-CoA acetyltransferase family protein
MNERIAVIDGCRTPFIRSGGAFKGLMHWKLGSHAVKGLMAKTGLPSKEVDHVIMGALFHDKRTSNVAREIVLGAGLPEAVPAHTCTVACISANMAATNGAGMIVMGAADTVIAGGVEFFDPAQPLPIKEYSTELLMGQTAERLASRLKISREEQDAFAVRSHQRAVKAQKEGIFRDNIVPVAIPGIGIVSLDNGPREDTTIEKISKLKGAFDPENGTVTAANSSFLTDGAAAVMLMSEEKAKALGLTAQAYIKTFAHTAQNPLDELLLGPAFAVPKALAKAGLALKDIAVLEIHEAFAVQMIANINLLQSDIFAQRKLGLSAKIGEMDMDRLNIHGGSLSLGHPFGATGARLIMDCCRRMVNENSQFGLVAGCAAGAVGNAIILENAA